MPTPSEESLTRVRSIYVGQRVRIYGGKEITVDKVDAVNTPAGNCFQFFAKGKLDLGYVATLAQVAICPIRAKGAAR